MPLKHPYVLELRLKQDRETRERELRSIEYLHAISVLAEVIAPRVLSTADTATVLMGRLFDDGEIIVSDESGLLTDDDKAKLAQVSDAISREIGLPGSLAGRITVKLSHDPHSEIGTISLDHSEGHGAVFRFSTRGAS